MNNDEKILEEIEILIKKIMGELEEKFQKMMEESNDKNIDEEKFMILSSKIKELSETIFIIERNFEPYAKKIWIKKYPDSKLVGK